MASNGVADLTTRPRRRRVVMERKVSAAEYEKHKEKMETLGLDPSDPVPCEDYMAEDGHMEAIPTVEHLAAASAAGGGGPGFAAGHGQTSATSLPSRADTSVSGIPKKDRIVRVRSEPKKVSLQKRTICEQVGAGRHERALARFQEQQAHWEAFNHRAAARTGRAKEHLVVNRAEEHRERLEVMELLDRATPEEVKSGGHSWYHSLRGEGTRFIQIGNMFSGLYLPVKMHKENYGHEIVRKPILRDLVASRVDERGQRKGPRTWRDDEYLLQRMRRYRLKMEEMAPGQLGHHELLEPDVVSMKQMQEATAVGGSTMGSIREGNEDARFGSNGDEEAQYYSEAPYYSEAGDVVETRELLQGPHFEACPDRLQFQAGVRERCTRSIVLKNTGTANISFEWIRDAEQHNYQESILPDDPTDRFTCKQSKGRLLPGRETTTCFTFTSSTPGVFSTSWSLKTSPELLEPIVEVMMHGVATEGDLLREKRELLQASMREQQILHQVQELVEDIVDSVRLQPPPLPDLSDVRVQERLFEEGNAQLSLYYTPHAWQRLHELRDRVDRLRPAPSAATASTANDPAAQARRPVRGRVPMRRPKPEPIRNAMGKPLELGVPSAKMLQDQLAALPSSTSLPSEVVRERQDAAVELNKAIREAKQQPLERSPIWWLAYETVTEIVMSIPGKVKSTRRMYSLPEWPFIPPLSDDPSPEEEAAYNEQVEQRQATRGEEEKETEWRNKFFEKVGTDCFGQRIGRFEVVAEEAAALCRIKNVASLSLRDRVQTYLDRQSVDSIEMGGSVLMYEVDLSFLGPKVEAAAAAAAAGGPRAADAEAALQQALMLEEGDDRELAKQRLQGVLSLLESSPLAVLVVAHVGTPRPDADEPASPRSAAGSPGPEDGQEDGAEEAEEEEIPALRGVASRMRSVPSLEPLLELLREVVEGPASAVEFVPHQVWLGEAEAFAEKVRSDTSENKVFLLENMSAFPEELGEHRMTTRTVPLEADRQSSPTPNSVDGTSNAPALTTSFVRVPWASREAWAKRSFSFLLPDIFVQDSFSAACGDLTLHTGFWSMAPQRYIGPFIEAEIAAFIEALGLPFRFGDAGDEPLAAEASGGADTAGEGDGPHVPAPLLAVIGGGGFGGVRGEEVLFRKLELLMGLSKLARHEQDGLSIALGGELAVAVLACALGVAVGAVGDYASKVSMRTAVTETLLEVLKDGEVNIRVPTDFVCQEVCSTSPSREGAVSAEPPEVAPKKGKKGKESPAPSPPPPPVEPVTLQDKTFALGPALAQAAQTPISLGFLGSQECFLRVDAEQGLLTLATGEPPPPPPMPAPPPAAAGGADAAAAEGAPQSPPASPPASPTPQGAAAAGDTVEAEIGIPESWVVKDIGNQSVEGLRSALRLSRGMIWNGALGQIEEEKWQLGTRAFLAAVETRLAGEDDEGEAAADEEEEDDEGDEDGEDDESKPKEDPEAEFELAVVIGRDSRAMLPSMMSPSLINFISQSGDGLLQLLRGVPLPGLLACVEKDKSH